MSSVSLSAIHRSDVVVQPQEATTLGDAVRQAAREAANAAQQARTEALIGAREGVREGLAEARAQLANASTPQEAEALRNAVASLEASLASLDARISDAALGTTQDVQEAPAAPAPPAPPGGGRIVIDGQEFRISQGADGLTIQGPDGAQVVQLNPAEMIPPQVPVIIGVSFLGLALVIMAFPIGRAIARWLDRRSAAPRVPDEVAQRLARIEDAVDTVAVEMERLAEGQRFTAKVLTGGTPDFAPRSAAPDAVRVGRREDAAG